MLCRNAPLIIIVNSALLTSSSPHPALTCPTALPGLKVWKTRSHEGMDCAIHGSWCVIFTSPGLSLLVFHYNNSHVRSDKADNVAISHDSFPNLSNLPHLPHLGPSGPFWAATETMEEHYRWSKSKTSYLRGKVMLKVMITIHNTFGLCYYIMC